MSYVNFSLFLQISRVFSGALGAPSTRAMGFLAAACGVLLGFASRLLAMGVTALLYCSAASAETVRVWDNEPLAIDLQVGEEVRVTFPTDVSLQVPIVLTDKLQALAPNSQLVYWKPTEAFATQRIIATSHDGQSVYILDLSASKNGTGENILIEDPARVVTAQAAEAGTSQVFAEPNDPPEIVLTRYASQMLYAPTRLLPKNPDIFAVEGVQLPEGYLLVQGQMGERYRTSVVGAWSGYGLYLTAVLLVNESSFSVPVRPDLVTGNFIGITPQHLHLGPAGSLEDRTTLYLISRSPFGDALAEGYYGY